MKIKTKYTIAIETIIEVSNFTELLNLKFFKSLEIIMVGNIVNRKKSKNTTKIVESLMSSEIIYYWISSFLKSLTPRLKSACPNLWLGFFSQYDSKIQYQFMFFLHLKCFLLKFSKNFIGSLRKAVALDVFMLLRISSNCGLKIFPFISIKKN